MKDFKSYIKNNAEKVNGKDQTDSMNGECKVSDENIKKERILREAKKYEGKSEEELMGEIMKQAMAGRNSGQLSDKDIDEFYKKVSPMLNHEQRKKLDKIIKQIR